MIAYGSGKSGRIHRARQVMPTPSVPSKTCRKCGEVKPLEEFQIDKNGKMGRKGSCRECLNAACRERYQKERKCR